MDYSYDYSSVANDEAMIVALLIIFAAALVGMFIGWLITLYPRYYMVKASGVGPAWSAFIPVWQDIQLFKTAGWKGWYYWVYLGAIMLTSWIPVVSYIVAIAGCVFLCITYWRISTNFGLGTVGKVLSLFLGFWVYWYVALTKKPYCNQYLNNNQAQNQNWYQNDNQQAQNQNWYQQAPQQQQNQNQNWYNNDQQ